MTAERRHTLALLLASSTLLGSTLLSGAFIAGCHTAGTTWMEEPRDPDDASGPARLTSAPPRDSGAALSSTEVGNEADDGPATDATKRIGGRSLGRFENTYYDFPAERDYSGATIGLFDARCEKVADVAQPFYETVCVQGSGTLRSGETVSFAKRDCSCAALCPRTGQRICFDKLDPEKYPWGRGAAGKPITPLLSVAVDTSVIALGTAIYIPEFDGLPRDLDGQSRHDGCFIAQDRGLKIVGKQIDVFTGHETTTKLWNKLMPSRKGVNVLVDTHRCARAETPELEPSQPARPEGSPGKRRKKSR